MTIRLALRELADAVFPQRCVVCGRFGAALHLDCLSDLPSASPPRCDRCWAPAPASPCPACRETERAVEAIRAPYRFDGPARRALLEAKFRGVTALLGPLARAAAEAVPAAWRVTVVVPVPLHPGRRRQRGYNQAEVAATAVATALDIPHAPALLRRTRATAPQASLDAARRAANLTLAFECDTLPAGERVLLVDDVTTTGATFEACARALRSAGADAVFALALARED